MPLAAADCITGLILAGGQNARAGGVHKGLLELHGLPLVEHVLGRLAPQVSGVMISADRQPDRYRGLVPRVLGDAASGPGHHTPLAGIRAGLAHAPTAWVAVVPCDASQLPRRLVAQLAEAVNNRGVPAACARADGQLQPGFCLLATSLIASLTGYIEGGGSEVHGWLTEVGFAAVDFDDAAAFREVITVDAFAGCSW
jgi:molybdopterin-guanine dinucleotide biosynthesis protein A